MYQKYYSEFLKRNSHLHHFACHSHHYWPDVTRKAMMEYWDDTAQLVDRKWEKILVEKLPAVQKLIAKNLNFSRPHDISFSSNTHDFLIRLLSIPELGLFSSTKKKLRLLTTDSEFYSFTRQIRRLEELDLIEVTRVPTEPFADFEKRFEQSLLHQKWDMIFLSHVFFNSGVAVQNLEALVAKADMNTVFVLDGYHSYLALPLDLSKIGDRVFFIAGGYKYAQSGEGCCFMTLPRNCRWKPALTGWFAEMGQLQNFSDGEVPFPQNGYRFAGSTMDYSALYRMEAVLSLFEQEGITVEKIHAHIQQQQRYFLEALPQLASLGLDPKQIVWRGDLKNHGHFLTFDLGTSEKCAEVSQKLLSRNILTDSRRSRLRFGFGLYHEGPYQL